jgi:hypothetical protein
MDIVGSVNSRQHHLDSLGVQGNGQLRRQVNGHHHLLASQQGTWCEQRCKLFVGQLVRRQIHLWTHAKQ